MRDLTFRYGPDAPVMRFPEFDCPPGDRLLILGASGSGKTTLLHLMSGLLRPSSGHIEVAGSSLSGLSGKALDRFRGRQIGIVFQRPHFVASLTVLENLLLPAFLAGTRPDRARALSLLTDLGVGAHAANGAGRALNSWRCCCSVARGAGPAIAHGGISGVQLSAALRIRRARPLGHRIPKDTVNFGRA